MEHNETMFEWIRGMYANMDEADKREAERFFPELKKSEDERIRKSIYETISQCSGILSKANQDRMLAWLEKRKTWNEAYLKGRREAIIPGRELGIGSKYDTAVLTWEDMQLIWQFCDILNNEQPNLCSSRDFFGEVLRRFKEHKAKKDESTR